jgi:hypothetical protein
MWKPPKEINASQVVVRSRHAFIYCAPSVSFAENQSCIRGLPVSRPFWRCSILNAVATTAATVYRSQWHCRCYCSRRWHRYRLSSHRHDCIGFAQEGQHSPMCGLRELVSMETFRRRPPCRNHPACGHPIVSSAARANLR